MNRLVEKWTHSKDKRLDRDIAQMFAGYCLPEAELESMLPESGMTNPAGASKPS